MTNIKSKIPGLQENIPLANHTTFRIGGPARYFYLADSKEKFVEAVKAAKEENISVLILGGGSNLLVSDNGFGGLAIKCVFSKMEKEERDSALIIKADAGANLGLIILESTKGGYSGGEWGFGIPGTIGGAVCGNAGRLGRDVSEVVRKVEILDENLELKILDKKDCGFSYRESRFKKNSEIILGVELEFAKKDQAQIDELLNEAKKVVRHSAPFPSAGCAFKNYVVRKNDPLLVSHPEIIERVRGGKIGTGYFIEQCGLKGNQFGGAKVWEGHANYIVNVGGAKAGDVIELMSLCQKAVREKFGIEIEPEIRVVS